MIMEWQKSSFFIRVSPEGIVKSYTGRTKGDVDKIKNVVAGPDGILKVFFKESNEYTHVKPDDVVIKSF